MANKDNPSGFRCINPIVAQHIWKKVASTNDVTMSYYDFVTLIATGANVTRAAAGEVIYGSIEAIEDSTGKPVGRLAATTAGRVLIAVANPNVEYVGQDDASATLSADDVGGTAEIVDGAGNTTTGVSIQELAADGVGTATQQIKIDRLYRTPGNAYGDNAQWVVTVNESFRGGTVGI